MARWPDLPNPRHVPEILTRHSADLPALLDYRRAIESAAAGFAAERALPSEIAELEALARATQGYDADHGTYRAADTRFHIGVARAAHSPLLMHALMQISDVMSEVIDSIIYQSADVLKNAAEYHQHIVEAIRGDDAEAARRLMLEHVIATENVIYSMIPEFGALQRSALEAAQLRPKCGELAHRYCNVCLFTHKNICAILPLCKRAGRVLTIQNMYSTEEEVCFSASMSCKPAASTF